MGGGGFETIATRSVIATPAATLESVRIDRLYWVPEYDQLNYAKKNLSVLDIEAGTACTLPRTYRRPGDARTRSLIREAECRRAYCTLEMNERLWATQRFRRADQFGHSGTHRVHCQSPDATSAKSDAPRNARRTARSARTRVAVAALF